MLAARFGFMYLELLLAGDGRGLVMANPIGLEDWKVLGGAVRAHRQRGGERARQQLREHPRLTSKRPTTLRTWAPEYDTSVDAGEDIPGEQGGGGGGAKPGAGGGEKDTTAIWKQWPPPEVQEKLGHYDVLGKQAAAVIPDCTFVEFPDLGHSPQIQEPDRFHWALLEWLMG
ncbi:hypothetical protein C8A00DRAFT_34611 [Chaetomidium leptoderma]|uniref:AB hydrolase-1 domain-containing protein n=1 Tax=Chaetomidium leptoderma TaxID=669021 RepID=A0AAN6VJY7_9PEZI|nr:hypothetical protein C8A00DRAFT_34611 [Chaetomidium leptoderma]